VSAIAEFTIFPKSALPELIADAQSGDYQVYAQALRKNARSTSTFNGSGWIFNTVLPYLSKEIGMKSKPHEFATEAQELTTVTETLHELFGPKERDLYLQQLDPARFSVQILGEYWNRFNGENEPESGQAMLAGIKALHDALSRLDNDCVLLLTVG
jgi:hypothetical protein